jgi:hypothetical protein
MKKFMHLLFLGFVACSLPVFAVMPEPTPENPNPQMPEAPPGHVIAQ